MGPRSPRSARRIALRARFPGLGCDLMALALEIVHLLRKAFLVSDNLVLKGFRKDRPILLRYSGNPNQGDPEWRRLSLRRRDPWRPAPGSLPAGCGRGTAAGPGA